MKFAFCALGPNSHFFHLPESQANLAFDVRPVLYAVGNSGGFLE